VVTEGTDVLVTAGLLVGEMQTFARLVAHIVRARVLVVAVELLPRDTSTFLAEVIERAGFLIRAGAVCVLMGTAAVSEADVLRTRIGVIALQRPLPLALTLNTLVIGSAGVLVIAKLSIAVVGTAFKRIATVFSTGIPVIAG